MNRALVDPIANAILYEGYILYPYRPSVKNHQRWTFGGLYPTSYCQTRKGTEASSLQVECLIHADSTATVDLVLRFLHLTARQVGVYEQPLPSWPEGTKPSYQKVESFQGRDMLWQTWQEASEREVTLGDVALVDLLERPIKLSFQFPGEQWAEPISGPEETIVGVLDRSRRLIEGSLEAGASTVGESLHRLTVRIENHTPMSLADRTNASEALLRALTSTHVLLGVARGAFISLFDPPGCWKEQAVACRNVGAWPVLVGEEGQTDMMLASPIILYDYPRVAPESPGDFFDGTEIDELLTLRVLTLTDDEKRAMAAVDERAGSLLARTESMAREQLSALHGTIRGLRLVMRENDTNG